MSKKFIQLLIGCCCCCCPSAFAQTVIVTDDAAYTTGQASAALDVKSTSKGFLPPRMTAAQRTAVTSPAEGLLVFQTDGTKGLYYYINGAWTILTSGAGGPWSLTGNNGTSSATNFLGTTDSVSLRLNTSNTNRMLIDSIGNIGIGTLTPTQKLSVNGAIVSTTTTYPNYAYNSAFRMAFGESNVPANETGAVVQYGSGSNTRNMLFAFTKTNVNTSFFGNDGNQMMLGSESTRPITFRTGLVYTATNVMASGTEIMRVTPTGVGIGVTNPANRLVVKDTLEIRHVAGVSQVLFTNTSGDGVGDLRIAGDGGDLFWQGGGGRALQMGSFHTTILGGDRQTATLPSFINGSTLTNTGVLVKAQRDASVALAIQPNSASQTANITEWRNASGTVLSAVNPSGSLGIGTGTPTAPLHVVGTNPMTLLGVQAGTATSTDSMLTISSGIVRKLPVSTFSIPGSSWSTTGNSGTSQTTNFVGTTSNVGLSFRTNNAQRMIIDSVGNVAIGTTTFDATNRERFLVDAGTTTSVNAIYAKGTVNSYFQMNIRNLSNGTQASSDYVATADNGTESTNFVDVGINGSGYTYQAGNPIETGQPNDCYLLGSGNDLYIVNNNAAKATIFLVAGTAAANEAMRISPAENVGIATTSPTAKLDVGGTFKLGASGTVLSNIIKTSVSITDNTNITYTASLTKTATVAGAPLNAAVIVNPRTALPNGLNIAWARVSLAGTVQINFTNTGAGVLGNQQLGTVVFDITLIQ